MSTGPEQLLIVQATPFCNIDCRYCYLPDRASKHRMTSGTFERVLRRVVEAGIFADNFTVAWHAGEPLIAPIDFYRECLAISRRHQTLSLRIAHSIQTNATLIDDGWARFLGDSGIGVGVSLDGPPELHDRHRVDRTGRGTFAQTWRGVEVLRRHKVPFGAICVLSYDHLDRSEDIYRFFRECGAEAVTFNIDEREGPHARSSFEKADGATRFRRFVREILRFNRADGNPLRLPNLSIDLLSAPNGSPVNHQVMPWKIVSVDWQGDICTFSPELLGNRAPEWSDFRLGNLVRSSWKEIAAGEKFRRLSAEIERGVLRCSRECGFYRWCGGGAPANKYFELGTFDAAETNYCRITRKAVCEANLDLLEEEIAASSNSQTAVQPPSTTSSAPVT